MTQPRCLVLILGLAAATVVSGCGSGEPQDIKEWMQASSAGLKGHVPELPQIKPQPDVVYEPGQLASPFSFDKLFAEDVRLAKSGFGNGLKPINPDAYPLSRVPLETIRMIGTLKVKADMIALLTSDRDAPRQVRVGEYVGQNFGRVVAIHPQTEQSEGEVVVKEMVLEKGTWVERTSRISQPVQGETK